MRGGRWEPGEVTDALVAAALLVLCLTGTVAILAATLRPELYADHCTCQYHNTPERGGE